MKKFLVALFVLIALAITMFPTTTTYAVAQTVTSMPKIECSWWSDSRDYDNYDDSWEQEEERQRQEEEQEEYERQHRYR